MSDRRWPTWPASADPVANVWTETDVRSGHYKVVVCKRDPTAPEESRMPHMGMHGHITECYDNADIGDAVADRESDLRKRGAARVRREERQ